MPLEKIDFFPLMASLQNDQLFGDIKALKGKAKTHINQHLAQLKFKL
jgi:hypothetical protein